MSDPQHHQKNHRDIGDIVIIKKARVIKTARQVRREINAAIEKVLNVMMTRTLSGKDTTNDHIEIKKEVEAVRLVEIGTKKREYLKAAIQRIQEKNQR